MKSEGWDIVDFVHLRTMNLTYKLINMAVCGERSLSAQRDALQSSARAESSSVRASTKTTIFLAYHACLHIRNALCTFFLLPIGMLRSTKTELLYCAVLRFLTCFEFSNNFCHFLPNSAIFAKFFHFR